MFKAALVVAVLVEEKGPPRDGIHTEMAKDTAAVGAYRRGLVLKSCSCPRPPASRIDFLNIQHDRPPNCVTASTPTMPLSARLGTGARGGCLTCHAVEGRA